MQKNGPASKKVLEQRTRLKRNVSEWASFQAQHMPSAVRYRQTLRVAHLDHSDPKVLDGQNEYPDVDGKDSLEDVAEDVVECDSNEAEHFELLLPSSSAMVSLPILSDSLIDKEKRLRETQLEILLRELRRLLRIKAAVYLDKKKNSFGQIANTRSVSNLSSYESKIQAVVDQYNMSRDALLRLDPQGKWQERLKHLRKQDVRPVQQNSDEIDPSSAVGPVPGLRGEAARRALPKARRIRAESTREISWIFKVPQARDEQSDATAEEVGEGASHRITYIDDKLTSIFIALRVEWSKTQARMQRFEEEVTLVLEEMRRVLRYFKWKCNWWINEAGSGAVEASREGCEAYAHKQASLLGQLRARFSGKWKSIIIELGLDVLLE